MFDYPTILAHWQDYPAIRIYYHYPDESGWARQLDDTHAALDNVPISGGLMRHDIVTFTRHEDDLPRLADVLQHYYRWQWSVAYLAEDAATEPETMQAAYTTLRETCEAAGCAIEGAVHGLAIVNAPKTWGRARRWCSINQQPPRARARRIGAMRPFASVPFLTANRAGAPAAGFEHGTRCRALHRWVIAVPTILHLTYDPWTTIVTKPPGQCI